MKDVNNLAIVLREAQNSIDDFADRLIRKPIEKSECDQLATELERLSRLIRIYDPVNRIMDWAKVYDSSGQAPIETANEK